MQNLDNFEWTSIGTIVIDFDGVFTDNSVFVLQDGIEMVKCSRSDGLGINLLRSYSKSINWPLDIFILSTEENPVVASRAKKMGIDCYQAITSKKQFIANYKSQLNPESPNAKILYVGNDLNDYAAMIECDLIFCPQDSHPLIRQIAHHIIPVNGGNGVIRNLVEAILPNSPDLLLPYLSL